MERGGGRACSFLCPVARACSASCLTFELGVSVFWRLIIERERDVVRKNRGKRESIDSSPSNLSLSSMEKSSLVKVGHCLLAVQRERLEGGISQSERSSRESQPRRRERERGREKETKERNSGLFFSFLSPTISFASQNCSTISSADAFPPAAFPFFSAHKGKMVRLIASSCSADAGSSLRHSGREIGERDEEARRRRASELLSPLSLSLPLSCSRCGGWEQKKREPPPRLLRGPLEPSATLLSASLTGRWHQPLRRGLRGRSTASERERGTMRTDEEERWRTAGGGKGAPPPPPPPLLSSEAGFLAALLSVRLRVLADLDRVCALVQRERPSVVARIAGHAHLSFNLRALFFSLRAAVDRLFSLSLIVPFFSPSSETKRRSSPTTSTSSTRRRPSRPASTSSRGSSSRPTATSWMSSARAASRSPSCSATRRRSSSARRARLCCAPRLAVGRG